MKKTKHAHEEKYKKKKQARPCMKGYARPRAYTKTHAGERPTQAVTNKSILHPRHTYDQPWIS